jgi:hypothetical protein
MRQTLPSDWLTVLGLIGSDGSLHPSLHDRVCDSKLTFARAGAFAKTQRFPHP